MVNSKIAVVVTLPVLVETLTALAMILGFVVLTAVQLGIFAVLVSQV